MNWVSAIGMVAAFLTTISFLPQTIRTWRTRSTADISLLMFLAMTMGVFLWLVYGVLLNDWPLIIANGVTLVLAGSILFLKLRHG